MMREAYVSSPEARPSPLSVVGEAVTVFGAGDNGKPFEVHLQHGVAGGGPPPHHHPWDEAFYVLEGEVELLLGDTRQVLSTGAFVHLPAGTVHGYCNISERASILGIVSDPRGGELFAALDANVKSLPDDLHKLIETSERYGVVWELPAPPA